MKRPHALSPPALEAMKLLGAGVRLNRRQRRWTVAELAERVGVTEATMLKVEHGDPGVRLGIAFEAAALVGVPLFDEDRSRRALEATRIEDRLAVLPKKVRRPREANDDF
jgi:transcriptional regulator with XRE-family HTH domain